MLCCDLLAGFLLWWLRCFRFVLLRFAVFCVLFGFGRWVALPLQGVLADFALLARVAFWFYFASFVGYELVMPMWLVFL